ncbi:hypothetical protein GCM10029964_088330 [Kibdelosporangium lantanae]
MVVVAVKGGVRVVVGLVGRHAESAVLAGCLDAAAAGAAQLVVCDGEPGIGKTRMAEELTAMAQTRGFVTVWGRASESEGAPPCWPWRQVLRSLSQSGGVKVAAAIGVTKELAVVAPEAFPEEVADRIDLEGQPESRFRVFDAVARFLAEFAADRGLVVVLDDLHHADVASLVLLRHVVAGVGSAPLLVFATGRSTEPGTQPLLDLLCRPRTTRVSLGALDRDAVAVLLTSSDQPISWATPDHVHTLTGGNPFFVGELARAARIGPATDAIPDTVRAAIRLRTDRLSADCRHQLRVAAVLGRTFSPPVVVAALQRPVTSCLDGWDEAAAAGLVIPADDGCLSFRHALVRDAIVADLSAVERSALHRTVAVTLETYYQGALAPRLSDLAQHWALVVDQDAREPASRWARMAGDEAMLRLSYEEAVRLYRQALRGELDDTAQFAVLTALTRALRQATDLADAFRTCGQAVALARSAARPDLLAEAALVLEPTTVEPLDTTLHGWLTEAAEQLDRCTPRSGLRCWPTSH